MASSEGNRLLPSAPQGSVFLQIRRIFQSTSSIHPMLQYNLVAAAMFSIFALALLLGM
jgi:hypothetical protein